jgi:hypothetical protein
MGGNIYMTYQQSGDPNVESMLYDNECERRTTATEALTGYGDFRSIGHQQFR